MPAPPRSVVAAFRGVGAPRRLSGGRGETWRAGPIVLKRADLLPDELEWQAAALATLDAEDVRVAIPVRALDGRLVVDGWAAWGWLQGRHAREWPAILDASERFHRAVAHLPRPPFLIRRVDPWAIGDRVAWGDLPVEPYAHVEHLASLASALRPVTAESQLVHGDLGGNVLFAPGLPPAVIDVSPYWRPPAFGAAIVVADALVWEGASPSILDLVAHVPDFAQSLLRALMYRIVTEHLLARADPAIAAAPGAYAPTVALALELARARGVPARSGDVPPVTRG